ncbi:MAG: [NiFe]-hydrogenase assembly chaperone HybE [Piscinibacter sp.]|nr:[NiFe]-hydrogenase assembly chaperone HybE [Piscinibacter sp.]
MTGLAARIAQLEATFHAIQRERLHDVPVLNAALAVQAVDFETMPGDAAGSVALGVLVTPWFMNLVRLPLQPGLALLPVGASAAREVGAHRIDFIGGHEAGLGAFEACSLFSPMGEFADQAAAVATARAVLQQLRGRPHSTPPERPARRGFLFGRPGVPA